MDSGLLSPRLDGPGMPISPTTSEMDVSLRRKRVAQSASWQDLLKYVCVFQLNGLQLMRSRLINLQAVIVDTEQSLGEVVREIDKLVVHNESNELVNLKLKMPKVISCS